MTTMTEAKMLLLTKDDFDQISEAASALSGLLWRLEYRREIKVKIPHPDKVAAVLPLTRVASGTAVDDHDDF